MPSQQAFEIMQYIQAHGSIDVDEFNEVFPDHPREILTDLVKGEFLEDADPSATALRQKFSPRLPYIYDSYRISDIGRAYLTNHPKEERRAKASEIRAWVTLGIALAALLLSVFSICWQIETWKQENRLSKEQQLELEATMELDAQHTNPQYDPDGLI